jgi:hypothetical protein
VTSNCHRKTYQGPQLTDCSGVAEVLFVVFLDECHWWMIYEGMVAALPL